MKTKILLLSLFLFSGGLYAAGKGNPVMVLKGEIIDNMCAAEHIKELAEFVPTHTKECALEAECAKSGYSLYTGSALLTFDAESTDKIKNFLIKSKTKTSASVKVELYEDKMKLVEIKEYEPKKAVEIPAGTKSK